MHKNCLRTNIYYYLLYNSHSGWLAGAKHIHPTISLSIQNSTAFRSRFKTWSNVDVFLSRRTGDDKIWTHTLSNQVIWVSWSVSRTCAVPQIYSLRWLLLQGQCTYLALTHWHTPTPHILLPLSLLFLRLLLSSVC